MSCAQAGWGRGPAGALAVREAIGRAQGHALWRPAAREAVGENGHLGPVAGASAWRAGNLWLPRTGGGPTEERMRWGRSPPCPPGLRAWLWFHLLLRPV